MSIATGNEQLKKLQHTISNPTTSEFDEIRVIIDPASMVEDYATAYLYEVARRNPVRAESIGITEEELSNFFCDLIRIRVLGVGGKFKDWRTANQLWIPAWIQLSISMIGVYEDCERGLRIIPVVEDDGKIDLDNMLKVSAKLQAFRADGISVTQNAFPRTTEGDQEVMTTVLVQGYVKSQAKLSHPVITYITAFLGMKLQEELAYKLLYRVRYDHVGYIRRFLLTEESLV